MVNIDGFNGNKGIRSARTKSKRARPSDCVGSTGNSHIDTRVGNRHRSTRPPPEITAAERRVLALVAQARSNKEIACDLGISPATVKRHMEKILGKLGLKNRVEAAIYGLLLNGCPNETRPGCVFRDSLE